MHQRERFITSLNFGNTDRVFYRIGKPRKATLEAWYAQGLPKLPDAGNYGSPPEFHALVGDDTLSWSLPIGCAIYPTFEEIIIEENEHGRVWRDGLGITMFSDIRGETGFLTRSYISHPVTDWETWADMRARLNPHSPERFPVDWAEQVKTLNARDHAIPPDLPIRSYFYLVELIHAIAEGRPVPDPEKGPEIAEEYLARAAQYAVNR